MAPQEAYKKYKIGDLFYVNVIYLKGEITYACITSVGLAEMIDYRDKSYKPLEMSY